MTEQVAMLEVPIDPMDLEEEEVVVEEGDVWGETGGEEMDAEQVKSEFQKQWADPMANINIITNKSNISHPRGNGMEEIQVGEDTLSLPVALLDPSVPLEELFSFNTWSQLPEEDRARLAKLLPATVDVNSSLSFLFTPNTEKPSKPILEHPLTAFLNDLRGGLLNSDVVKARNVVKENERHMAAVERQRIHNELIAKIRTQRQERGLPDDPELAHYVGKMLASQPEIVQELNHIESFLQERQAKKRKWEELGLVVEKWKEEAYEERVKRHRYVPLHEREDEETNSDEDLDLPPPLSAGGSHAKSGRLPAPHIPRAPPQVNRRKPKEGASDKGEDVLNVSHSKGGESTLDASLDRPKGRSRSGKRKPVPPRKEAKAALPTLPTEPSFTLFSTIHRVAQAHGGACRVEDVVEEVKKDKGLAATVPKRYSLSTFCELALQFLANPPRLPVVSERNDMVTPKITAFDASSNTYSWKLSPDSYVLTKLESLEQLFYFATTRTNATPSPSGRLVLPGDLVKQQRCIVTIEDTPPEGIQQYHKQEKERFEIEGRPYVFNILGHQSIVGPLRKLPPGTAKKSRDHPLLVSDRSYHTSIVNLVINAGSRLPGGIGTRADVAHLTADSIYVKPGANIEKVVSAALDRIQLIADTPLRYDPDQKLWVYSHRLRTVEDFDRVETLLETALKIKAPKDEESGDDMDVD